MSDKFYIGNDITGFEDNGITKPISRVTLMVDSENAYTAGDDTGMELSATCIHATQAMVDSLLASFKGKTYQMYSADDANLDPAAELGDGVTVAGVYSPLSRVSDDGSGYPGINSPGEEELEDEYPAAGPMTQEFNRQLAGTRSLISKTSEEILLKVEGIDGKYTKLKTTVDGVTVTDETGTTKIKGSSIETESIAAGSISADKLVLTGSITWADLTTDLSTTIGNASTNASKALTTANGAYTAANGAQTNLALLANGLYQGGTFISGTSIYSPELVGDEIKLANGSSYEVGKISMQVSNTPAFDITSNLSLRLQSAAGWNAYLGNGYAEGSGSVAAVLCNASGVLNLYGAAIAVSGANFGSTLPSSGVSGQVFFLLG